MTNEVFPDGHWMFFLSTRQASGVSYTGQLRSFFLTADGGWVIDKKVAGTAMRVVRVADLC